MRARASQETTNSGPFGKRSATRLPLPMPAARRARASSAGAAIGLAIGERAVVDGQEHPIRLLVGPAPEQRRDGQGKAVARIDHRRRHAVTARRGETSGRLARTPAMAPTSAWQTTLSPAERDAERADAVAADRPVEHEGQLGEQRRRPPIRQQERRGLAGQTQLAVVVLYDAIEKDGQESSVHETRRALVGDGERDRSLGPVTLDLHRVLGDAGVVGADVEGMIEIHPPGAGRGVTHSRPRSRTGPVGAGRPRTAPDRR